MQVGMGHVAWTYFQGFLKPLTHKIPPMLIPYSKKTLLAT